MEYLRTFPEKKRLFASFSAPESKKNSFIVFKTKPLFKDMSTIVLDVQDESLLTQIKKACQLLKGVASVRVHKSKNEDITKTAGYKEAMDDIKHGRVYHAESVDDMFKQILG